MIFSDISSLSHWWSGSELIMYITKEDLEMLRKGNFLCTLNHKYDIDWLFAIVIAQESNLLGVVFFNKFCI